MPGRYRLRQTVRFKGDFLRAMDHLASACGNPIAAAALPGLP